jgi:predicted secreted protein
MKENLKDILAHLNPDVDQEILIQYLQGELSNEKQHEVEKQLLEGDFESEALEGLQVFKQKPDIRQLVDQLNYDLKKKTVKRKQRRKKLDIKVNSSLWITLLILLMLIVISYIIIRRFYVL